MILPGIYASQISGHLYSNSYTSIATATVDSGGASSITFSGIPSGYTHLQLRQYSRGSSGTTQDTFLNFNSDSTTSNYISHQLYGDGSSAAAFAQTNSWGAFTPSSGSTANTFGVGIIDILDYSNTNKNKTWRVLNGWDANGTGYALLRSGLWMNTNAITSITFAPLSGGDYSQYSQFALYGVK